MNKIGITLAIIILVSCARQPEETKPNIVFILADDMGVMDLGIMGNDFYETPHIDQLASEGMFFSNAYSSSCCAPTRACLMTGKYSPRHGIFTVGNSDRGPKSHRKLIPVANETILDTTFFTLVDLFKQAGYFTAHIGKWHLGGEGYLPTDQGFDINIAGYEQGYPNSYFSPYQNEYLEDGPQGEYLTDRLTDEAIQIVEDHREEPFFLYLSYYAVHSPYQCKPELKEKYESKPQSGNKYDPVYAGMLETMDTNVGKLLQKLKDYGLEENTLVIFYSDNGAVTPVTSTERLRGSKGTLYQGGILAPLIVKYPKFIQPGTKNNNPVNHIDILPTIAEFVGAELPDNQPFDGISMMELLKGENIADERSLYWHFPGYLTAYQDMEGIWRCTPASAIMKDNWKLIQYYENDQLELFDLVTDPYELNNLAGQNQEKTRELKSDLQSWRIRIGAKVPQQLNPDFDTTRQISPIDNPIYKYW